jgi:hypothetical protein
MVPCAIAGPANVTTELRPQYARIALALPLACAVGASRRLVSGGRLLI